MSDGDICNTITSGGEFCRQADCKLFSDLDIVGVSTFPQDYDFLDQGAQYICGMSVPPVMMANVSAQVASQWFGV